MKILTLFMALISLCGCGIDSPSLDSLLSKRPRVLSVEPVEGAVAKRDSMVAVEFSEQIDPSSIDTSTLAIVKSGDSESSGDDVVASVVKGKTAGVEGVYSFEGEGRVAIFRAATPYEPGALYRVIATDRIVSVDMIPLNQRPVGAPEPFVSEFVIEGEPASDESTAAADAAADETGVPSGGDAAPAAAIKRPASLVINEVLYDAVGDDTDGVEFIELAGDAGAEISGYKIVLVKGSDGSTNETISIGQGALIPSDGIFLIADSRTGQSGVSQISGADMIDNFDPLNGPDCMQLIDDAGRLVDSVGYGSPIIAAAKNGLACSEGAPAPKSGTGKSLSRTNALDTGDNSSDFQIISLPTPGVR